jgi:hypothetical protein
MPAGFRERGRSAFSVQVVDFSANGCKIECNAPIIVGDHAWLKLPGLEGWYTRVAWIDEGCAGLDFARPFHPAVAASLLAEFGRVLPWPP